MTKNAGKRHTIENKCTWYQRNLMVFAWCFGAEFFWEITPPKPPGLTMRVSEVVTVLLLNWLPPVFLPQKGGHGWNNSRRRPYLLNHESPYALCWTTLPSNSGKVYFGIPGRLQMLKKMVHGGPLPVINGVLTPISRAIPLVTCQFKRPFTKRG